MESLSKTRERRANAGNRMGALIDKEEDDFYKSTYGGFFEEENDNEYKSEDSESDDVDSDFDCDETDEVVDFEDDEESKKRKGGRVVTKAYREPKRKVKETVRKRTIPKRQKTSSKSYNEDDYEDEELDDEEPEEEASEKQPIKPEVPKSPHKSSINQKKSLRTSTQLKSKATQKRTKLAQEAKKDRKRVTVHYKQLTQEEMLAEAKETEKLNRKSLERYEKLELEKSRKNKISRKQIRGPIIRYHSMTMPLIQELDQTDHDQKCSRNFITFTEEDTFIELFKLNEPKKVPPTKKPANICAISRLPTARYKDPVTGCSFSCPFTFRTLRETYYKQLEMLDESQKTDEIKKFLEWRKNSHNVLNTIIKSETPLLISNIADC